MKGLKRLEVSRGMLVAATGFVKLSLRASLAILHLGSGHCLMTWSVFLQNLHEVIDLLVPVLPCPPVLTVVSYIDPASDFTIC